MQTLISLQEKPINKVAVTKENTSEMLIEDPLNQRKLQGVIENEGISFVKVIDKKSTKE